MILETGELVTYDNVRLASEIAMQGLNLNTPGYVKNAKLIAWVADMVALCKPDDVYWCDGSDAEYQHLTVQATHPPPN